MPHSRLTNSISRCLSRLITALLLTAYMSHFVPLRAQTAVVLAPVPQLQFFTQQGYPLAFGCVFTYQTNSVTPLGTYTDNTGVTLNSNPVILSAGGSANIWLQAGVAYTFRIMSAGGSNCSEGQTLYTVNGIGGGSSYLLTPVAYSPTPSFMVSAQVELFTITLTGNASANPLTFVGVNPPAIIFFQITQDATGGHSWSWPANSTGGCTINPAANSTTVQEFVYNGSVAEATGPCSSGGTVDITNLVVSNSIIDEGTLTVDGLSLLNGGFGCVEGSEPSGIAGDDLFWCSSSNHRFNMINNDASTDTVVGAATTDTFTHKTYDTAGSGNVFKINGNAISAVEGNTAKVQLAGTISGTSVSLCTDANGNDTTSSCPSYLLGSQVETKIISSGICTVANSAYASCGTAFTWPTAFADTNYALTCTTNAATALGLTAVWWESKATTGATVYIQNGDASAANPISVTEIDCIGIHP
jgi:hypothetical protein